MDRQPLRDTLQAYRSAFPNEAGMVERIDSLAANHADCFERACRPGHLTASAWVVSHDGKRHLLMHHRKLNKWLQPGGHADGDPDLVSVALKEVAEETGLEGLDVVAGPDGLLPLDVDVHAIPARFDAQGRLTEDAHDHHDVRYLVQSTADDAIQANHESNDLRWCEPAEVRRLTNEPSVVRLLEKAQRRLQERPAASTP